MEAVSWAAVVMAGISMVQNAATTISNNRTKREMEAAKLAHDQQLTEIRVELDACRESHSVSEADLADLRQRHTASEADRDDLRERLSKSEVALAELRGRVGATEAKAG